MPDVALISLIILLLYCYWLKATNTDIAIGKFPIRQTQIFKEKKSQLL